MSLISLFSRIYAYGDAGAISNPTLRHFDWSRKVEGQTIDRATSETFEIPPGETLELFSGVRSLGVDGTTAFDISINAQKPGVYRVTAVSGTAPGFRTSRALALNGEVVTVTINNNATARFALSSISAGTFAAVNVGDVVFVPSVATGDGASPFSALNGGFWSVIGKGPVSAVPNKALTLVRLAGEEFEGAAEVVTLTSNNQLTAHSAAGVQVGDKVDISAGFSSVSWQTYEISAVTPSWIEFTSGANLPLESSIIPGAAGITVYTHAKRFLRVEVDREAVARLNGSTDNSCRLSPVIAGDAENAGWFESWGTTFSLSIVNRDPSQTLKGVLIAGE